MNSKMGAASASVRPMRAAASSSVRPPYSVISHGLLALQTRGGMTWTGIAWVARPGEVIEALAHDGFEEYRREVARIGTDREPPGGVWQGLNRETGAVASAIWVRRPATVGAIIFIDIDGHPVEAGHAPSGRL